MSDVVIRAECLGKKYLIGHLNERERYTALRDVMARVAKRLVRSTVDIARGRQLVTGDEVEEFWALKDVNFEISRGDVVGIIGLNGAGKSTLLKVLSRITEPSEGRVMIKGRVASLLEVGTGFHPELTGRENIFLNGAILGMSRGEIKRKFEEIVDFADIEKFIDTPVKRYSSGMYVRLAFAVAAHIEPEILIVDEVLAVGDAEFQRKCLGKMRDVAGDGRTVLFVSHQMAAVQNLCKKGILLTSGRLAISGSIQDVANQYLLGASRLSQISLAERLDRKGSGIVIVTSVVFNDDQGQPLQFLTSGAATNIILFLARSENQALRNVRFSISVDNELGQRVLLLSTHLAGQDFADLPNTSDRIKIRIERLTLAPGQYSFTIFTTVNSDISDWVKNAGSFDVKSGDFYGSGRLPNVSDGCLLMDHSFTL